MRFTEIRYTTIPILSGIRKAVMGLSEMTASVAAIHTDEIVDGKRIVG